MYFNIVIFLITYLICSINPAIVICKIKTGEDIRNLGSKNAGTTNSIRILGKALGILVFTLDIIKVFISYGIIIALTNIFNYEFSYIYKSIFLIGTVLGHCYPLYYNFKGGKGIAVTIAAIFMLNYQIALVCVIIGIILIAITRMVSIGSIGGILIFDIMILVMEPMYIASSIIISCIIIFKHRTNIQRIINGKENRIY